MLHKKNFGWPILIFLSLSPLIPWLFALPIAGRFISNEMILTSLGQMMGLVGFAMFSLNFVLSARLKVLEDFFGGMDKLYIAHHILGGLAFIFLMIHPLLLISSYAVVSIKDAFSFLFSGSDVAILFGEGALSVLMAILIVTFYAKIPYEVWRWVHKCIGISFFLGMVHALLIPSDISQNGILRGYMILFMIAGSAAYLYRTVLGRFFVKREKYLVEKVEAISKHVTQVVLKPLDKGIAYEAGQFIFVSFTDPVIGKEVHPFSISSYTKDKTITITVKAMGDFTSRLKKLHIGTGALVEGAFGRFNFKNSVYKKQIWIAGGIGITPFLGMAKELLQEKDYDIILFYTIGKKEQLIYLSDLQQYAKKYSHFTVVPWYTEKGNRLTATVIEQKSKGVLEKEIFICGPAAMMFTLRRQFKALGVSSKHIHTEEFSIQ